jgi:GxxExxY protein
MIKPVNEKYQQRDELNKIAYKIRGALFEVFKILGPGLLESIYEEALFIELQIIGLKVGRQINVPVYYKGRRLKNRLRLDLIVEDSIILELKSVDELHKTHFKQLTSYLKLADKKLGYLVNFNCELLEDGKSLIRMVHNF